MLSISQWNEVSKLSTVKSSPTASLHLSKGERVFNVLLAVVVAVCLAAAAAWWAPGSTVGKLLVLALIALGGVLAPVLRAVQPYATLGAEKLIVRNQWRRYVVHLSDGRDITQQTKRELGASQDIVVPVLVTATGKVVMSGARYQPGTPREKAVDDFIRRVRQAIPG